MKNEDQFFINAITVLICRNGHGILSDHIPEEQSDYYGGLDKVYEYHQVVGYETRYVIMQHNGICYLPHINYESPISDICPSASNEINSTRKYKRELDTTYFKYYDDAEEVMNNIISFCKWLKRKIPEMSKKDLKKVMFRCEHLIKDVPDSQELQKMRQLMIGFPGRGRCDLSSLERVKQDDLDLKPSLR